MAMFVPPSLLDLNNCWILDSGATHHMINSSEVELTTYEVKTIRLGDSSVRPVVGKTNISIPSECGKLELRDVLCVPGLNVNLVSISCLLDSNCDVLFQNNVMSCTNLKGDSVICTARRHNNLWYIKSKVENLSNALVGWATENLHLWHLRLNHLNYQGLQKLARSGKYHNLPMFSHINSENCVGCALGKQHKLPFPTNSKGWRQTPLELIHTDVVGPINISAVGNEGRRYLLTIVDDCSRKSWIYFLQEKSEVVKALENWTALVEKQLGYQVKTIRSDNGGEFLNNYLNLLLSEKGILHELTIPYTPEQNGVVERFHRTMFNAVRSMLHGGRVPLKFWWEAVKCFNYTSNRLPKGEKAIIPEEVWQKKTVGIAHLKIFGSPVTVHSEIGSTKLTAKSWPGIFLGYAAARKGYRIWNREKEEIIESRNVTFFEEKLMDKYYSFPWEERTEKDKDNYNKVQNVIIRNIIEKKPETSGDPVVPRKDPENHSHEGELSEVPPSSPVQGGQLNQD